MTTKEFTERIHYEQDKTCQKYHDIAWVFVILRELYKEDKITSTEFVRTVQNLCGGSWKGK